MCSYKVFLFPGFHLSRAWYLSQDVAGALFLSSCDAPRWQVGGKYSRPVILAAWHLLPKVHDGLLVCLSIFIQLSYLSVIRATGTIIISIRWYLSSSLPVQPPRYLSLAMFSLCSDSFNSFSSDTLLHIMFFEPLCSNVTTLIYLYP